MFALDNVTVAYHGDITILNGVSVQARAGQVTGIIGPNGAGKSTVLKTLFGFLPLRVARIMLRGQDISRQPSHEARRQRRGLRPAAPQPVRRAVRRRQPGAGLLAVSPRQGQGAPPHRLGLPTLSHPGAKRHDPVSSMSGGQQRFVEFGRALLIEPSVILLDEPTAMLAPKISKEIYAPGAGFADEGMTVILVDQNVRRCAEISGLHVHPRTRPQQGRGRPRTIRPRRRPARHGRVVDGLQDRLTPGCLSPQGTGTRSTSRRLPPQGYRRPPTSGACPRGDRRLPTFRCLPPQGTGARRLPGACPRGDRHPPPPHRLTRRYIPSCTKRAYAAKSSRPCGEVAS